MITVIDYKAGNLTSVVKALDALGCQATVTADPEVVRRATKVILPGVGHFQATQLLEETGLTSAVSDAIAHGVPFLGICVGLQWLFEGSTEAPAVKGLSLFRGECERFAPGVKVPHVGWNEVRVDPHIALDAGRGRPRFCLLHPLLSGSGGHGDGRVTDLRRLRSPGRWNGAT